MLLNVFKELYDWIYDHNLRGITEVSSSFRGLILIIRFIIILLRFRQLIFLGLLLVIIVLLVFRVLLMALFIFLVEELIVIHAFGLVLVFVEVLGLNFVIILSFYRSLVNHLVQVSNPSYFNLVLKIFYFRMLAYSLWPQTNYPLYYYYFPH